MFGLQHDELNIAPLHDCSKKFLFKSENLSLKINSLFNFLAHLNAKLVSGFDQVEIP